MNCKYETFFQFSSRQRVPVIVHVEDTENHVGCNNSFLQVPKPIATIHPSSPTISHKSSFSQVTFPKSDRAVKTFAV